jgi:hypothetical protein
MERKEHDQMKTLEMKKGRQVLLYDEELLRRRNENRNYLLELTNDNLLLPYTFEAGIYLTAELPKGIHGGWESPLCELRGHFLGHWLSAAAMHYEATGDRMLKAKADEIVDVLAECQEENGGQWVASIPMKYLYRIADGKPTWAPQYTIHKTLMGLLDMYELAGNEKALEIAVNFGGWFYDWSGKYTREHFQKILAVETGGMLEIWAILYRITKKEMFRELMDRYYREALFDGLLEGRDVLTNMHANTTIPEILGAAECYEVTGEEKYLEIVKAYWKQAVTDKGSYATGGQTCGEIWSPDGNLSARLGDKNQEHCTVYNMMRVADFLFRHTGDAVYMDYWEKNLYNGIMAQAYWKGSFTHGFTSDYPQEGLLTYFLPLRAGGRKGWSSRTQDFFCCHGSLVQANAAHNKGIYYEGENSLYICQYLVSDYTGENLSVRLRIDKLNGSRHLSSDSVGVQEINPICARYPNHPKKLVCDLYVEGRSGIQKDILIRIPDWAQSVTLTVNGQEEAVECKKGSFVKLTRVWGSDVIHLELGKGITVNHLPGSENMVAFMDGPVVLAGLCDEECVLYVDDERPEELLVDDNEREWGNWMNTYKTVHQERGIRFVPLNQIGYDRYTVYFPIEKKKK